MVFDIQGIFKSAVVILLTSALFSCQNDPEKVKAVGSQEKVPTEISFETEILYSDSAVLRIKLTTPKLIRFSGEETPYVEFPQGLMLTMFDSAGQVETTLKANYGVNYPNERKIEVKKDVEVVNNTGEILNTEHLIWLRDESKIYTEEFVKITTPDEIIYGDGLEANETFTKYRIKNIKGTIAVKEDEGSDTKK
ncbi:MAG: LPS export ABC transporter periplasmic protein LptC [Flavobacteriales bacterium]|nr:LPS export ABC transporter periplasmic protein LptC [Flavobacteriales bacterium]